MLGKGKAGATRLLSRSSVETMTMDHLTPEQKAVSSLAPGFFDGHGWGFGMAVVTRRDDLSDRPGELRLGRRPGHVMVRPTPART